jgi:hypothetical protein
MNTSRCCDQPICTECLVQIKRADPDVNHLDVRLGKCSHVLTLWPAGSRSMPFLRRAKLWRTLHATGHDEPTGRIGRAALVRRLGLCSSPFGLLECTDGVLERCHVPVAYWQLAGNAFNSSFATIVQRTASEVAIGQRCASTLPLEHILMVSTAPDVVLIDALYPNFQDKIDAVQAAVQRRANRRIVFRQVGDRLVPVGITSSRDMAALLESQYQFSQQLTQGASGLAGHNGRPSGAASPSRRTRRRGNTNGAAEGHPFGHVGQEFVIDCRAVGHP